MHKTVVYHTIGAPGKRLPADIDISPQRFEEHLRWLAKRPQRVVPLRDTLSAPHSKSLITITFDDGYRDNLTIALPLLEKYDLPATIFMVAGFVGKEGYLTSDDLKFLAAHPLVSIGSHTFNHRHLTRLSEEEVRFELAESKTRLEEIVDKTIDFVAYPYGDCNEAIERLSEKCGYTAGWSVWNGNNTPFSRWRVPLGTSDSLPRFIAKVSPFYFPIKRIVKPPVSEARERREDGKFLFAA